MIKYFVRTTGERVLNESFSQIDYELLIDYNHNSGKAFLEQLQYISTLDCDAVILEDDIILCKNFKKRIEKAISEHPNEIINFFTDPMKYFDSQYSIDFIYNQCTYYPKSIIGNIHRVIIKRHFQNKSQEVMMKRYLSSTCSKHYRYRPCLVQHIDNGSLMNHNVNFCRRSPYFIDYLEELGITYKKAYTEENKIKLIDLMKEKFKDIDN